MFTEKALKTNCTLAAEYLVAKETDISLRRWWRPKTELQGNWIKDINSSGGQFGQKNESINAGLT